MEAVVSQWFMMIMITTDAFIGDMMMPLMMMMMNDKSDCKKKCEDKCKNQ